MKNNEVPDVLFFGAYIVTLKGCFLQCAPRSTILWTVAVVNVLALAISVFWVLTNEN
ncbi:MAG: hypothetical protein IJU03_08340 [Thermoguttaceae bacterium]|nr:hypothetical protein [Thermoguttaceae bacterium]